jgi:hypothetical protein
MLIALALTASLQFSLPDPKLTPGVVRPISAKTICETTWHLDRRHVTEAMKAEVYRSYGAKKVKGKCCEVDHRVPRSIGGADDMRNLWPQLWAEAKPKDRLEVKVGRAICNGEMTLKAGQAIFLGDWRSHL